MDVHLPHRAAEAVIRAYNEDHSTLNVYWLSGFVNRESVASELRTLLRRYSIAVLVVRGAGFTNPNSIVEDVVDLLEKNRGVCIDALGQDLGTQDKFGVVLIGRARFTLGQSSSPVELPEWLYGLRSRVGFCTVTDLSWRIDVPVGAPELDLDELRLRLYELEGALLRRLVAVHDERPEFQDSLFRLLSRRGDISWTNVLGSFMKFHQSVISPSSFRPSAKKGDSFCARLWSIYGRDAAVEWNDVGRALESALGISGAIESDVEIRRSLTLTLFRASNGKDSRYIGLDILNTIVVSLQYLTVAVHAERHPRYPVDFLHLFLDDLRRSMLDAEATLMRLGSSLR